jgi:hypothetical protein
MNRPGVESALILSRKNGSIIKVAGLLEASPENTGNATTSLNPLPTTSATIEKVAAKSIEDHDADDGATKTNAEPGPTPAERIASEVFQFVSTATSLASSLQSTATPDGGSTRFKSGTSYKSAQYDQSAATAEHYVNANEVQLLRLRSQRYEIVIFPDSKFLCCVVQNMERHSR